MNTENKQLINRLYVTCNPYQAGVDQFGTDYRQAVCTACLAPQCPDVGKNWLTEQASGQIRFHTQGCVIGEVERVLGYETQEFWPGDKLPD